jgi:pimeloyl-ACP methyl ester carboxylesterase
MSSEPQFQRGTTNHRLAYIAAGPQTAKINLLCIHGWACQASNFTYLFTSLLKTDSLNFQAFAIDLPGHGNSDTEMYPRAGIDTFAKAVLDFIAEMQLERVVLMGHSMGVRVILETYLQSRLRDDVGVETVAGLILLDGSHYKFRKSVFDFDVGNERNKALTAEEKKEGMAEAFRTMFSTKTPVAFRESTIRHVEGIDLKYNEAMRKGFIEYDYLHTDDSLEAVGRAALPVLNVQSTTVDEKNERVPLRPGEVSRWMKHVQDKVPQVKQVVVLDASHFPHVDQPAEVAAAVEEFVDGLGR